MNSITKLFNIELMSILGKGRAKKGMFEGDLVEGELEMGQVAWYVHSIKPVAQILNEIWQGFRFEKQRISQLFFFNFYETS
jgi:enoyl-[acyl-carrier protein] reductase II